MIPVPFFPINQVNIPLASGLQSVNSLFTLPGPKAQSPGTITSRRQSRFLDQRRAGDRRACSLLPTLTKNFDRGKRPKSPLSGEGTRNPTSQPPEGVAACKGGGASDQETIGPAPSKTKGERCARKEGQPVETDLNLQLSDNQQKASIFARTQCRPTLRMALNLIMASGVILGLMLGGASRYSIDYFDC
ncbi:MAG: hypothetical protein GY696_08965 [Gammaproteobacteria bacterium]|nr:hypothetical protein [Gammaproteobacteria bacterium]